MYFEDLAERAEQERTTKGGKLLRALVLAGLLFFWLFLLSGVGMDSTFRLLLLGLLVLSGLALLLIPFWNRRRGPHQGPARCPQCSAAWAPFQRDQVLKTRACPLCNWVLPSRLPPEARKIHFEPGALPRVWLQGELETATVVETTETSSEPQPADADDANPYRASPVSQPAGVTFGGAAQGCFVAWWYSLIGPPRVIFASRDKILRDPNLAVMDDRDVRHKQARDNAFVRSQRRLAWLLLICCYGPLLVFGIVYAAQTEFNYQDDLTTHATRGLILLLGGIAVSWLGLFVASMVLTLSPRWCKRFWMGGRGPIPATTDPETGYHGIRIRLLHRSEQSELPRVRFRYRCANPGRPLLRIVNHPEASALELDLPVTTPGQWSVATYDLLLVVRQSDPEFSGDELHLVADSSAGLECWDFEVLPRF